MDILHKPQSHSQLVMPFYMAMSDATQHARLLQYLPDIFISSHITTAKQLDFMWKICRRRIIWHVISRQPTLEWEAAYTYRASINWRAFIMSRPVPLDISQLIQIYQHIKKLADLFRGNSKVAGLYYNDEFCTKFPGLINWRFAVKLPTVSQEMLCTAWQRIPIAWIIEAGRLDCQIVERYGRRMNWSMACDHPLLHSILHNYKDRVIWNKVVKHTQLSTNLIRVAMKKVSLALIATHQHIDHQLLVEFIAEWPMDAISQAQQLTAATVYEFASILHANLLATNKWTQKFVLYSGAQLYYLIISQDEAQEIRKRNGEIREQTTVDGARLQVAILA